MDLNDPMLKFYGGIVLASLWALFQYRQHKKPKKVVNLVVPPPNIHIDPENIPMVEEEAPRRWNAADATVAMGVPLKPREY